MAAPNEEYWSLHGPNLPYDLLLRITLLLEARDVCALASCSRFWFKFCSSDQIWSRLFKLRWPTVFQPSGIIRGRCTDEDLPCQEIGLTSLSKHKLWQAAYIHLHFEMASRARAVIESMRMCLQQESVEVADYKKAMVLLRKTEVGLQDVVINLFLPIHSVLVNLLALHYCMLNLNTQVEVAREALIKGKILDRPVCIRWWTFGGWANGFRRQDEMHVKILSLCEIIKPQHQRLFKLMERGTVNEILRIQISADFRNSAWIARDMHSQR